MCSLHQMNIIRLYKCKETCTDVGNENRIAAAYIEKALTWPAVNSEDVKVLQTYSLFLCGCCSVMKEHQYMQELDMPTNMRAIMTKLPIELRENRSTWGLTIVEFGLKILSYSLNVK